MPARMAKLSQLSNLRFFPAMLRLGSRLDRDCVPMETVRRAIPADEVKLTFFRRKVQRGSKRRRCSRRWLTLAQRRCGALRRVSPSTVLATWVGKPPRQSTVIPCAARRAPTGLGTSRVLRLTWRSGAGCLTPPISGRNSRAFTSRGVPLRRDPKSMQSSRQPLEDDRGLLRHSFLARAPGIKYE